MTNGNVLELKDVGPIHKAKLEINKINIIGGQNSTGKSTSSKLLYCFLKSNSSNRDKLVASSLLDKLNKFNFSLRYFNDEDEDVFHDLVNKTRKMRKFIKNRNYDNFDDLLDWFDEIEILFNDILDEIESTEEESYKNLVSEFNDIKHVIKIVEESSNEFFKEVMKELLFSELEIEFPSDFGYAKFYDAEKASFAFDVDFKEAKFTSEGKFNINEVFYLESFSIFDNYLSNDFDCEHVSDLKEHLFPKKIPSKMFEEESLIKLEEIIGDIVGGRIIKKKDDLIFVSSNSSYTSSMKNTASGIKQISVIQSLLKNRFLGENCVLMMDEQEVNLHPEWQIKLARILVLLAKEGNITIYINSHSPMFIEAMDTFAEYYDYENYTNYYLSISSEEENMYDFIKVDSDELYLIYDNLGDPYDYLDRVRLSKGRKEVDDDFKF